MTTVCWMRLPAWAVDFAWPCAARTAVWWSPIPTPPLRDAQRTVMELHRFPNGSLHLVVNRVRQKLLRQLHATIDDAIDKAGLPLLGVVPEDDALPLCLDRGLPILLAEPPPPLPLIEISPDVSRGSGSPAAD